MSIKRYVLIKNFVKLLHHNDICIFSGQEMCKEAYQFDRPGNFYIQDFFGITLSFALGVAMCTNKRVFVFVGEGELLREMSAVTQMAISECENIYLVVLDNCGYQSTGGQPNIFDNIVSKKGFFYNFGFLIQDYSKHFKNRESKQLQNILNNLIGPVCILMEVDKGIKRGLVEVELPTGKMANSFTEFVRDKELSTSLFESKIVGDVLNLDEISAGGNK